MTPHVLIQAIMQQTTVLIAQLATRGGVRAPLGQLAEQVFTSLSAELQAQGVRKNVIADMFGLSLRTFHRKLSELSESRTIAGRTVWEAVFDYIRLNEPVSAVKVHERFARDDREVVAGVLTDLANSGLVYRAGRGMDAVFRHAGAGDFAPADAREASHGYIVWQVIYRHGPLSLQRTAELTGLTEAACLSALAPLVGDGRVYLEPATGAYTSPRIDVPVGESQGWEAAVLDHFQAMVAAICSKLASGSPRARSDEHTGGATISLDLWPGHPVEAEVLGTLSRVRRELDDLRARVDEVNRAACATPRDRVVLYFGQHLKRDEHNDTASE